MARLSYLLTYFRAIEFQKVILTGMQNLRLSVGSFTTYDKYSVLKSEYLRHPIHMQLSPKEINFSELSSAFLK